MQKTVRKILRVVADYDPDYYDMYADANEAFFAQLYVQHITEHAASAGIHPPAIEPGAPHSQRGVARKCRSMLMLRPTEPGAPRTFGFALAKPNETTGVGDGSAGVGGRLRPTLLEAGCQAGRLVVPFAKLGFHVTGIDTSRYALRRAREHAKAAGVDATFVRGDLLEVLRDRAHRQYDIVVCAEVVYLSRQYRQMLQALAGALRPGGLLCVSHRPKFYYLFEALRRYDLRTATEVLSRSEGPFLDSAYYNWQTEEELRSLYSELGVRWVAMHPIDRLAWLSGMSPARLTQAQREEWLKLELSSSSQTGTCARYVLVVAERPTSKGQ